MQGKYTSWGQYLPVYLSRQWVRLHVSRLIQWKKTTTPPVAGCTAIIGMCSRLEDVLAGNLACLNAFRWPDLKEVIVVVDAAPGSLSAGLEERIKANYPDLRVRFLYYNEYQVRVTESFRLPYIYSWLSWSIGLNACTTRTVLLHDYDALILSDTLQKRYAAFTQSGAVIQGIRWYKVNGFLETDRLATTFEAFVDVDWIKSFEPVGMFNKIGILNGRSVDFDTTLEAQARYTPESKRTIMAMGPDDLVHPSQMIHQYTMFRKRPGAPQASFSIPMIPFFQFLSGNEAALANAGQRLAASESRVVDLFADSCLINFSDLTSRNVDWLLKQMVQVCLKRKIAPFKALIDYGSALYRVCGTPDADYWSGDFDPEQRRWIETATALARPNRSIA